MKVYAVVTWDVSLRVDCRCRGEEMRIEGIYINKDHAEQHKKKLVNSTVLTFPVRGGASEISHAAWENSRRRIKLIKRRIR